MDEMARRKAALERAVEVVEGQTKLAMALGVRQSHVSNWIHRDRQGAPAEFCLAIEQATGGAVTRHDLRPDVFGAPVANDTDAAA